MNSPVTFHTVAQAAAEQWAEEPWLLYEGSEYTFRDLLVGMNGFAGAFHALGVEKGDVIGLHMENRPEWIMAQFGLSSRGGVLVPLNTRFQASELTHVIAHSHMSTLVWGDDTLERDSISTLITLVPELVDARPGEWTSGRFPALRQVIGIGSGDWPSGVIRVEAPLARPAPPAVDVAGHDMAMVIYTSGTTGLPKGAVFDQRSLVQQVRRWGEHMRFDQHDRSILVSPLFWVFGCVLNSLVPPLFGCSLHLHKTFVPARFLEDVVDGGCTYLQGVPVIYKLALMTPEAQDRDLTRIRLILVGGTAADDDFIQELARRAPNATMMAAYGLTEGGCIVTFSDFGDPTDVVLTTVGHPCDNYSAQIVNPRTFAPVPSGTVGELCIRGDNMMLRYLDDPAATERAMRDGWLHTGDLASMDERGYISIVGRLVDAFKTNGMNVYPVEIETVLLGHPAVAAAAIVGVSDERAGVVGRAYVVAREGYDITAEELSSWCAPSLADYKRPRQWRVVGELPMTASGKVKKHLLDRSV